MDWKIYTLIGIVIVGFSDIFRKMATSIKDPFFTNLIFQLSATTTTVILFFIFSKNWESNKSGIIFAILGGATISIFSLFSFKALSIGPVSTVIPLMRIGGIALLVLLGIILLKEKINIQGIFGLLFSALGIYLLFSNK